MEQEWDGVEHRRNNQDMLRKIELQLAHLVAHMESEQEKNEYYRSEIKRIIEKHEHVLFGNGRDGHVKIVDRLEQDLKKQDKHRLVLYTTAVGLALKTVWDLIVNK